jgi:hypothetical protein
VAIARAIRSRQNASILHNWQKEYPVLRQSWAELLKRHAA